MTLGERLLELRRAKSWSQFDLAMEAQLTGKSLWDDAPPTITATTIGFWERNERTPSPKQLVASLKALSLPDSEIMEVLTLSNSTACRAFLAAPEGLVAWASIY